MVPFRISIARLLRVAATLISVALVCSMSGCSSEDPHANTSPQTSMSDAARGGGSSGGTDEILRESKPSETLLADPLSGDWESNVPTLAPLDGGLDRAWVECMPKDTAESASWKRSVDHTRVWLHTGAQSAADKVWSCMDDRLQLDKVKKTSDGTTWNGQSVNGYNIYQKNDAESADIVWQYGAEHRANLVRNDISAFSITLPYAWKDANTGGDSLQMAFYPYDVADRELCRFVISWSNDDGDINDSMIEAKDIDGFNVQMWVTHWAYAAATDPSSIDQDDARRLVEMQSGGAADFDQLVAQIKAGNTSGLSVIDEYLKTHIAITERS